MSRRLEDYWVKLLDSDVRRGLSKTSVMSGMRRSRWYRGAGTARRFALTAWKTNRQPGVFGGVETVLVFLGHVKSGGTMLGSLIDAHPNAIVADEIGVFRYVAAGFRRDQIIHLLVKGSRREAMKGRVTARRLNPYSWQVPSGWQGRYESLLVAGDSRAGPTTRTLAADLDLIDRLDRVMGDIAVKYVHVVNNPFDPISVMVVRDGWSMADAVEDYFDQCSRVLEIRKQIPADDVLEIRYGAFIADPVALLGEVCMFLGLPAEPSYIKGATSIIDPSRLRERHLLDWSPSEIAAVEERIDGVPFLDGYTYRSQQ